MVFLWVKKEEGFKGYPVVYFLDFMKGEELKILREQRNVCLLICFLLCL